MLPQFVAMKITAKSSSVISYWLIFIMYGKTLTVTKSPTDNSADKKELIKSYKIEVLKCKIW